MNGANTNLIIHYDNTTTPMVFNTESSILELKSIIASSMLIDFDSFNIFLSKYGQIDWEEILELPWSVLDISKAETHLLFIKDKGKLESFADNFCSQRILGWNFVQQIGFKLSQQNNTPICLPCSIFCRKGEYSWENVILNGEFVCKCGLLKDNKCIFCNINADDNLKIKSITTLLKKHAEALVKFENSKRLQELDKVKKRNFDFQKSIEFGWQRVTQYNDEETINRIKTWIPWRGDNMSSHDYVKVLLKWFKCDFFKWCNQPPCTNCNQCTNNMLPVNKRLEPNSEEKKYLASRVEVYQCNNCHIETRFPRYNSPFKLWETRTGRCGEYANVFGCILNAVGFKVRFVDNFEDHVWNEFYSNEEKRWIHVDSCEEAFDTPLLYEQGWGRVMTFILAHSTDGCYDVTSRYIKCWTLCQERRSKENEDKWKEILEGTNMSIKANMEETKWKDLEELERLDMLELENRKSVEINVGNSELKGRQSGSEEWRTQRGEMK